MLRWAYLGRCLGFAFLFVLCILFILSPDLLRVCHTRATACPEEQRACDEHSRVEGLECATAKARTPGTRGRASSTPRWARGAAKSSPDRGKPGRDASAARFPMLEFKNSLKKV